MLHHDVRRLLDALHELNPAQIEGALTKIKDLRRNTEAISEIEARINQGHECPFCGDARRQEWGRKRTRVRRDRYCTAHERQLFGCYGQPSDQNQDQYHCNEKKHRTYNPRDGCRVNISDRSGQNQTQCSPQLLDQRSQR
ncbi:hypothetical protein SAMN06265370_101313 [Puniceibacterium sediminis]|uniref:Uncharacterized protein n=1 Tax=Puniceibacterium sediminis TaxID=1608407 RepID=A0A238UYY6_9RHOB|nr:hypothetical protein SAMN06265370_101313 [Puniceibacterium sediminis]